MEIRHGSNVFQVGERVGDASNYSIYMCMHTRDGTKRQCLLQIAKTIEDNGGLQRAAYILDKLQRKAVEVEEKYAREKEDPKKRLNYQLHFPEILDSFLCTEQKKRWINILAFRNVDDVTKVVPLRNLTEKDGLRIDQRSSAWIMGKTLKLLGFVFDAGISIDAGGNNILIYPEEHYVLFFDWSAARVYLDGVPAEVRCRIIAQAAQSVIVALGGANDGDKTYSDYLLRLARGSESNAERAHGNFYELVDALWPHEFYPFTTEPLE